MTNLPPLEVRFLARDLAVLQLDKSTRCSRSRRTAVAIYAPFVTPRPSTSLTIEPFEIQSATMGPASTTTRQLLQNSIQ